MSVLGRVILAGPLQGRVVPSMCMWALLPALPDRNVEMSKSTTEGTTRLRHHRIQLSLEKGAYFCRELSFALAYLSFFDNI